MPSVSLGGASGSRKSLIWLGEHPDHVPVRHLQPRFPALLRNPNIRSRELRQGGCDELPNVFLIFQRAQRPLRTMDQRIRAAACSGINRPFGSPSVSCRLPAQATSLLPEPLAAQTARGAKGRDGRHRLGVAHDSKRGPYWIFNPDSLVASGQQQRRTETLVI